MAMRYRIVKVETNGKTVYRAQAKRGLMFNPLSRWERDGFIAEWEYIAYSYLSERPYLTSTRIISYNTIEDAQKSIEDFKAQHALETGVSKETYIKVP